MPSQPDEVTDRVLQALESVLDPEVDQPITSMGFVHAVEPTPSGGVDITLKLPTYFCAPNFTWLMLADVRDAAESVVGAGRADVRLLDHFEAGRIDTAVSEGATFTATFRQEASAELDALRDRFRRKAFLIRQERVCRELEAVGGGDLTVLHLGTVEQLGLDSFPAYLGTREELGIDCGSASRFLVAADGRPVGPAGVRAHRRAATVMAVSFEGNGHLCRALLAQRTHHQNQRGEVA